MELDEQEVEHKLDLVHVVQLRVLNVTRGQRWAPATFGGWAPFSPWLRCRARLSYGKLHLPTWLLTHGSCPMLRPGQRRRPSATGRGTSLVLLLSAVLQEPVRTTQTGQRRCREVPSMVPDPRTSSRSSTRGTTSLADFPGCAKSPSLIPSGSGVQGEVHERRYVENTLSDVNAHTVLPSMKTAKTERIA